MRLILSLVMLSTILSATSAHAGWWPWSKKKAAVRRKADAAPTTTLRDKNGKVLYADNSLSVQDALVAAVKGGVNLTGLDLYGGNIVGLDLRKAQLREANLYGANASGANLEGADLTNAILYAANFTGAKLKSVRLTGADCYGIDVTGADLTSIIYNPDAFSSARGYVKK